MITEIATNFGMTQEEISACFEDPEDIGDLSGLPNDEKYEHIYNMVQLMKIDGRLYKEEIQYCAKMATKLGYDEEVLTEETAKQIEKEANRETVEAIKFAEESDPPTLDDLMDDVYWETDNDTEASKVGRHFFND